jgi:hypothetical protein
MKCKMKSHNLTLAVVGFAFAGIAIPSLHAQTDPGPRPGSAAAGSFFATLNSNEQTFFNQAQLRFQEVNSVSGAIVGRVQWGSRPNLQRQ